METKEEKSKRLRNLSLKYSKSTSKKLRDKALKNYYLNPSRCLYCGEIIKVKDNQRACEAKHKKFCNNSHSQIFNNRKRKKKDFGTCKNCGRKLVRKGSKYCNIDCQYTYEWKEYCKEVTSLGYFPGMNSTCVGGRVRKPKRYILEKQNGKCAICGITEWNGEMFPTVLDHIDGDSTNWSISNIRVICRNCDGLLPTYCGKNKGKSTRKLKLIIEK
ncbi:MAG TPA: HNH endonuclease signature motif containing protein [Methanofastidiosum sp.]|nr:HNH endonuclease signature motif containing protein [Methanofastidiosum sp.]